MISCTRGFSETYTNPPDAEIVQDHIPHYLSQVSATFETCKHDIDSYTNLLSSVLGDFTNSNQPESVFNHIKNTENLVDKIQLSTKKPIINEEINLMYNF